MSQIDGQEFSILNAEDNTQQTSQLSNGVNKFIYILDNLIYVIFIFTANTRDTRSGKKNQDPRRPF